MQSGCLFAANFAVGCLAHSFSLRESFLNAVFACRFSGTEFSLMHQIKRPKLLDLYHQSISEIERLTYCRKYDAFGPKRSGIWLLFFMYSNITLESASTQMTPA
jgi:hypothetical protein